MTAMNAKRIYPFQPAEVLVVEASAGAGKTYALAKRYLNLLINPGLKPDEIPIKSILAITFTNKATLEMKERILEFLKRLAFNEFSPNDTRQDDLRQTFGISDKEISLKAANIMDLIIRDYDLFQVQTIDSFINTLLTGCALHIDRTAGFRIKDTPDSHLTYSLDLLIEESARNPDIRKVLGKFLEQYISSSKNAGWFPKDEIFKEILSLYQAHTTYGLPFRESTKDYGEVIKLKLEIFKRLEELATIMPEGQKLATTNRIKKILEKRNELLDLNDLPWLYRDAEPPMKKGEAASPEYIKKWQKLIPLAQTLAELETQTRYPVYTTLFNLILKQFDQAAAKEDVLFLNELNSKAADIITGGKISLPELYYRLATRFRHYLLDEFQDTSELQWRNLEMMIEDALASGGSLFYVGDQKQAIFRFRGGEPKLFKEIERKYQASGNVTHTVLTDNWRSEKAIVEFNNSIFSQDNLKQFVSHFCAEMEINDAEGFESQILDIYETAIQQHLKEKNQGYVRMERVIGEDNGTQAWEVKQRLMTTIRQLSQRFPYSDMAILTRDNKTVELITNWLLDEKIEVDSERTSNVLINRMILEIISLLKFLRSPVDELHFGGFILGEIFSKASGISQHTIRNWLFELKSAGTSPGSLYTKFRHQYPKIWEEYLEWFFKSAGFISPYELIVSIYQRFAVMKHFPDNQAFFVKFLDFVKAAEDEYLDLDELLEYLEEQAEKREADLYVVRPLLNAVRVQTIHKSKGLEFPVVLLPFLEMDIGRENPFISRDEETMSLHYIKKEHTLYSAGVRKIYNADYLNNLVDELNNVYVATTRAKKELYIFIPTKENKEGKFSNLACYLMVANEAGTIEQGAQVTYPKTPPKEKSAIKMLAPSDYYDWLKNLKEDTGPVRNRDNVIEGNLMHFLLANIPDCAGADTAKIIKTAVGNAELLYPFIKDFSTYQKKLKQLLDSPKLKPFFHIGDGEVFCEKEFANKYGDVRRIDRLIIKNKEAIIVDYKSGKLMPEITNQIKEYAEIILAIYPDRTVKAHVIFLDTLKTEEIE